jgi:hypothetical protein
MLKVNGRGQWNGVVCLARMYQLEHCRNADDAEQMVKLASDVNSGYQLVESVDVRLVRGLSWTAAGHFPPLATAIGGLVAQETLISLTGKFSPLRQWVRREGGRRERDCNVDVVLMYCSCFLMWLRCLLTRSSMTPPPFNLGTW